MAQISTTIALQDKMTPVFKSILRALDNTIKAMKSLEAVSSNRGVSREFTRAEKSVRQAQNALIQFRNGLTLSQQSASGLNKELAKIPKNIGSAFNIQNLAAGLYVAERFLGSLKGITEISDKSMSTVARIGLYNESDFTSREMYGQVYRTALDSRTGISETGELVTRLLTSGVFTGKDSVGAAINTAGIINKALVSGGASGQEAQRALLQLAQGLSSGVLQGDELRSIREQSPYLASVLAQGLEKVDPTRFTNVAIGDLKELGAQGQLTSDVVIKAFAAMEDEINAQFETMPKTAGQAFTNIESTLSYFLYLLSQSGMALGIINDKLWEFSDTLASEVGVEYMESFANAITLVVMYFEVLLDVSLTVISTLVEGLGGVDSVMGALAVTAAVVGTAMFASFVMANLPLILIISTITIIISMLQQMGYTTADILGFIASLIIIVGAAAYNIVAGILYAVTNLVVYSIAGFMQVAYTIGSVLGPVVLSVTGFFVGMLDIILYIVEAVASLSDMIFGTDWATGISNMRSGAEKWYSDQWENYDKFKEQGVNTDEFINKYKMGEDIFLSKSQTDAALGAANSAFAGFEDFKWDTTSATLEKYMKNLDLQDVQLSGGNLDSVGKIDSDVSIKEEDIKLLRDIAAQEVLLNLNQVVPQVHASFGDVRESADVGEIMDILASSIEEAYATSLN